MRTALFGGSFDPPHLGHCYAACHARWIGQADEVWVLPVARHPYLKDLAPWEQRWALCQAAFADLSFVHVRDDELHNPSGYTFDLIERLITAHPQRTWMLVGGTDTENDLPQWYRGHELAQRIAIHAVPRRGYDDLAPGALPAISSTLIRQYLAAGDMERISDLVPATVLAAMANCGYRQE